MLVKRHQKKLGKLINNELLSADVVLGTLVNCNDSKLSNVVPASLCVNSSISFLDGPLQHLPKDHFQLTMIDECSQAKEASCWLLVPRSTKMILAGDYHQLPPVIHKRVS